MNVVRKDPNAGDPAIFQFMRWNLPKTLTCERVCDGYGCDYYVCAKDGRVVASVASTWYPFGWFLRMLKKLPNDRVQLKHPEYYSDFEDVIRKYETQSGKSVIFEYWEAA